MAVDLGLDTSPEEMQSVSEEGSYPEGERGPSAMSEEAADKGVQLHRPCSTCRAARVLCDRGHPCGRCLRIGFEATCQAPPTVKRGRPPKDVQQARLEMLAADLLSTGLPPSERVQPKGTAAPSGAGKLGGAKASKAAAPPVVTVSAGCQTSPAMSPVLSGVASSSSPSASALAASALAGCALGTASSAPSLAAVATAGAPPPKEGQSVNIWLRELPAQPPLDPYAEQKIAALRQQLRSIGLEPCV